MINKALLKNENDIVSIKREKYVLKELRKSPFIVDLKYTFQDSSNLYLVQEYLSGGDIFKLIRKRLGFSNYEIQFYVSEIIMALKILHRENIVYRDMKPENIMIDQNGHVKLVDFGFAKRLNDVTKDKTYTVWGTPGYISPEILTGAGHSYKTDIWSLGIVIWEILGGFNPFVDVSPQ